MSDKIEFVGKNSLQKTVENIRDKVKDIPKGSEAFIENNVLYIKNNAASGASSIKTKTEKITSNQLCWILFPEDIMVIDATIDDYNKLFVFFSPAYARYVANRFINENSPSSSINIERTIANKEYTVTYTYIDK